MRILANSLAMQKAIESSDPGQASGSPSETLAPPASPPTAPPDEIGGPTGPEPTRYGDWEKKGRCIDF